MRSLVAVVPLIVLASGFACQDAPRPDAQAKPRRFAEAEALCTLDDSRIDESSGVAASPTRPGVWYTHNDSGDSARFFRFDESGRVDAVFSLKGATAFDWEDMASATVDGRPYLYFADIGDNLRIRPTVTVYRVPEPTGEGRVLEGVEKFVLAYPDGRHDAEALFVRPGTGDLYVVAKSGTGPQGVYKLAAPEPGGPHTLAKVGALEFEGALSQARTVTGADVSPDGSHVLVRTYLAAYEYEAGAGAEFDAWAKAKPATVRLRAEVQGEAIAYASDGRAIVTTSEKAPCAVSRVRIDP